MVVVVEKPTEQIQHKIDSTSENVMETDLTSLNVDCIREILMYLNGNDLWNFACSLPHFMQLIKSIFTSMHQSNKTFTLSVDNVDNGHNFLRNFGSSVQSLCLINTKAFPVISPMNNDILCLLLQYCHETLIELELNQFVFYHLNINDLRKLRPLFSRLQKLVFNDCFIGNNMLEVCNDTVEVILNRTFLTREILYYDPIYDKLTFNMKTLKIIGHETHNRPDETHLINTICTQWSWSRSMGIPYIECLEIEMYRKTLTQNLFEAILQYNMKKLKVYGYVELSEMKMIIDMLPSITVTELTLGHPYRFRSSHLMRIYKKNENLEQLIVILDLDPTNSTDYRTVRYRHRTNEKPMNAIIVGTESQIRSFNIDLPANAGLSITTLRSETVMSILNLNEIRQIKMSNEQIKVLRNHGLIPL